MALHLHRAERTDLLADGLGDLLAVPLADPFEQEVVVVPAKGVERWLTQRLSHRLGVSEAGGDGVCAGVRFVSPHSLVSMLLDRDRDDPWSADRLVWPMLTVLDASLDEPWAATLARHLGHGSPDEEGELRRNRRWSVARRLAGHVASYARQRPQVLIDWREGRDTDGAGADIPDDLSWQPELVRRLIAEVGAPPPDVRHARTLERLRADGSGLDLPARLSLFGHTRLPRPEVELLAALGHLRDVHLWLPQPSPGLWADLVAVSDHGPVRRRADDSDSHVGHPLLASLGRDARELQRTLAGAVSQDHAVASTHAPPASLLEHLQADLRANRAPTAADRAARTLPPGDRSLQVHACHGPARQVEVLREVLVGLLQDDPTLEPRDIVVMCPDIETYAPLIEADFGLGDVVEGAHPAHGLRVRLADRALSATNPLLGLAVSLVELAGGRVSATEVLDLLARDVVRRRFRLDDDALARLTGWVGRSGVRWGLDREQRGAFAMSGFGHNTWRSGLDRILVGVAMSGDGHRFLGTALPLDDVGSSDIELVGRLAEAVDRVERCVRALTSATTVGEWTEALAEAVRGLGEVTVDDQWQVAQFERELAHVVDAAGPGGTTLRLSDVRAMLTSRLGGRPTRANFRTGTLTVCTMVPMRSVPHRVVCLLGLDDGLFPRTQWVDGDDVLARDPLTGERDVRSEDRQLLLDAVLAARERLVVCYTGANEHTGAPRPPAVPLGELIDAAHATADGGHVVVRHPLQPYDRRNLEPEALGTPGPFSFDASALAGARAGLGERHPRPRFLAAPLPAAPPEDLDLVDLERFLTHPVRSFLRGRLDVGTPLEADEVEDRIPISLGGLDAWAIGDRLLSELAAGVDAQTLFDAEFLRGSLPPGQLGEEAIREVVRQVGALREQTRDLLQGTPRSVDIAVDLGGGRRLTGTVPGIHGTRLVALSYSRLGAKQRLVSWVRLLALATAHPDESWSAHTVGRAKAGPTRALAGPLDHRAEQWLRDLVAIYDEGRCRPLPAPPKTALAWAEARAAELRGGPHDPASAAAREWVTDPWHPFGITGEDDDAWHERVWGRRAPLEDLLADGLGEVAWRLWEPLVSGAERVAGL